MSEPVRELGGPILSVPMPTWSIPQMSTRCSTCRTKSSSIACGWLLMNPGTTTTPKYPPRSATARASSSDFARGCPESAFAAECETTTGWVETASASQLTCSLQ